jgi:hypothetical protein
VKRGHQDVDERADDEGADDPDRHVALRIAVSSAVVEMASKPM